MAIGNNRTGKSGNPKKWKKSACIVFCGSGAFLALVLIAFFFLSEQFGRLSARCDLIRGHYEIRTYGLHFPTVFMEDFKVLESYGVAYRRVAGCVVNDFVIESVEGYNSVMKEAIGKDIGVDVDAIFDRRSPAPALFAGPFQERQPK